MKLYTRQGDDGSTGLFGGRRVGKDALRVEAYGTVDELNSALGLARAACRHDALRPILEELQSRLFDLGANLCTPPGPRPDHIPPIDAGRVAWVERTIDAVCEPLAPMRHFVLPGGSELAARLHLARTICRRAERVIVALGRAEPLDPVLIQLVNRLSDLLFALARRANQLEGEEDVPWRPQP